MVFNTPFNNISVISSRTVLLEETGVPREKLDVIRRHMKHLYLNEAVY
jgi:hypothetical protein